MANRKIIYDYDQEIPLRLSSEKYFQVSINNHEAETFLKQRENHPPNQYIQSIKVEQQTLHELKNGDADYAKQTTLVVQEKDRTSFIGHLNNNYTVSFLINKQDPKSPDNSTSIYLKGSEVSDLRYFAIKVCTDQNTGRHILEIVPAYQILATEEAQDKYRIDYRDTAQLYDENGSSSPDDSAESVNKEIQNDDENDEEERQLRRRDKRVCMEQQRYFDEKSRQEKQLDG